MVFALWASVFLSACKKEDGKPDVSGIEPGASPLRRLNRNEYDNTVYQLLGDASRPGNDFTPDEESNGFTNQAAAQTVSALLAEQYETAAERLALDNVDDLLTLVPACSGSSEAECDSQARMFFEDFGLEAFRRPLTSDELDAYAGLFATGTTLGEGAYDGGAGLELVVESMLQSPSFLYRVELGEPAEPGEVTPLTSYEIASRLSYTIWGSMPDDELFRAAADDLLQDPDEIQYQARRMLAVPRARDSVKNFVGEWLGLNDIVTFVAAAGKDTSVYPDYSPALLPLFVDEAEYFVEHAIFDAHESVKGLFTDTYSMMNADLANFYGLDSTGMTDQFEKVDLDPSIYSGLFTQAGLLALNAHTDSSGPVQRGYFVRQSIFCQNPPAMPEVVPPAPTVDDTQTTRDQFSQHESDPACAGCHSLMDGSFGFGFEHFDGMGHYRATQNGLPIDATGNIIDTKDANGTFDGVQELGQIVADSQDVQECISSKWFMYAFGRADDDADAASLGDMRGTFSDADFDLLELIVATTVTDGFRYRYAPDPDAPLDTDTTARTNTTHHDLTLRKEVGR
jgi:hypothetical protein